MDQNIDVVWKNKDITQKSITMERMLNKINNKKTSKKSKVENFKNYKVSLTISLNEKTNSNNEHLESYNSEIIGSSTYPTLLLIIKL